MRRTSFTHPAVAGHSEGTSMSQYDGLRIVSKGQHNIARDVGAWIAFIRMRIAQVGTGRYRHTRGLEDLYRMTDRELWDLGLSRSDFPAIEDGTYRRN
jgi:uncharacterized protein YjiS (DUF1127 family)